MHSKDVGFMKNTWKQWWMHSMGSFLLPGLVVPVFLGVDMLRHQSDVFVSRYALLLLFTFLIIITLGLVYRFLRGDERATRGDMHLGAKRAYGDKNSSVRRPKSEHVPNSARAYAANRAHHNSFDARDCFLSRVQEGRGNAPLTSAGDTDQERQVRGGNGGNGESLPRSGESHADDGDPEWRAGARDSCTWQTARQHKMITQPHIDLNRSIISQTTREGVLRVVEAEWAQLDEVNLITSLYRLAILRGCRNQNLQWRPIFQKILDGLDTMLDKTDNRSLANMIWALAKIGFDIRGREDLIARVARKAAASARDARSQDISFFMGGENGKKNLIFRRTQEISNLLWGMITMNYRRHPEVVQDVNHLFLEIARFQDFLPFCAPQELSNIAWSYSRSDPVLHTNVDVQKFLVKLAEYCGMRCSEGIPRNVAMVAWGYYRLKVLTHEQTEKLFGSLEKALTAHPVESWKPQEIATLLLAYADTGIKTEWFNYFLPRILGNLTAFKPTDFSSITYAFVKAGYHESHVLNHLYENMPDFSYLHRNDLEQIVRAFLLADFKVDQIFTKIASSSRWGSDNPQSGGLWSLPTPLLEETLETYASTRKYWQWYQAVEQTLQQRNSQ
eukprot:GEMP01022014.1.p1 GENE.GEMP01022014.1~~GEMP01022014.1.p1  ORF type:complete len:616 (+),score=135.21 GEMP01022014.1:652-2499(+)